MSRKSRDKGARFEREVVSLHKAEGIHAERVPLSGAAGGAYAGDVDIYVRGPDAAPWVGECKVRGPRSGDKWHTTIKTLHAELAKGNEFIVTKYDGGQKAVTLPWERWIELAVEKVA